MSARKFIETETKTAQERVAQHRERLKAMGVKRLDLSVTPQAFESLRAWSAQNNLSYSEAAEQLFLAASAPISSYLTQGSVASVANPIETNHKKAEPTTSSMADTSAVSAFFANRQTTAKPKR